MATIEKKRGRWRARVRREGHPDQSKTFEKYAEARRWARHVESALDQGLPIAAAIGTEEAVACATLGTALERYRDEVLPCLSETQTDGSRLRIWMQHEDQGGHPMRDRPLGSIRTPELQLWADQRNGQVKPATVAKELGLLSRVFTAAITPIDELIPRRRVYGFGLLPPDSRNPVRTVQRPSGQTRRNRRLSSDGQEEAYLSQALKETPWLADAFILAIETGCRRRELMSLRWEHIELDRERGGVITITSENAKTSQLREIPLTPRAFTVLQRQHPKPAGSVFDQSVNALKCAWRRARNRARRLYEADCARSGATPDPDLCRSLRWHDLRREAVSRLLEAGVHPSAVAQWSGHQSEAMLRRYASHDARAMSRHLFAEADQVTDGEG